MTLYDKLPQTVTSGGKSYRLHPAWPNVLAALDVVDDPELSEYKQVEGALDLLVASPHPVSAELLKDVVSALNPDPQKGGKKLMDLRQDWQYIYAGFAQAYGVDLFERRDLHWMPFVALLKSLPKSTRMSEIVGIRGMDIPKPTKYNAEYRAQIARLKAEYSLKSTGQSVEDGLRGLFDALKAQAERR